VGIEMPSPRSSMVERLNLAQATRAWRSDFQNFDIGPAPNDRSIQTIVGSNPTIRFGECRLIGEPSD
jgi:hypothetical protein